MTENHYYYTIHEACSLSNKSTNNNMLQVLAKQERTFENNLNKTEQAITALAIIFQEQYAIPVQYALDNLCDADVLYQMRENYAHFHSLSLSFFFFL